MNTHYLSPSPLLFSTLLDAYYENIPIFIYLAMQFIVRLQH